MEINRRLISLKHAPTLLPFSAAAGNANTETAWNRYDMGQSSGIAPAAFIAAYKVLWNQGDGSSADVYAAVDQAVADGVDVISMSLGGLQRSYFRDIAFLNAAKVRANPALLRSFLSVGLGSNASH